MNEGRWLSFLEVDVLGKRSNCNGGLPQAPLLQKAEDAINGTMTSNQVKLRRALPPLALLAQHSNTPADGPFRFSTAGPWIGGS